MDEDLSELRIKMWGIHYGYRVMEEDLEGTEVLMVCLLTFHRFTAHYPI